MVKSFVRKKIQPDTTIFVVRGMASTLIFFLSCFIVLTLYNEKGTITRIESMIQSMHEDKGRIHSFINLSSIISNLGCSTGYSEIVRLNNTTIAETKFDSSGNDTIHVPSTTGSVKDDAVVTGYNNTIGNEPITIQQNVEYKNEEKTPEEAVHQSKNEPIPIPQTVEEVPLEKIVADQTERSENVQIAIQPEVKAVHKELTMEEEEDKNSINENEHHFTKDASNYETDNRSEKEQIPSYHSETLSTLEYNITNDEGDKAQTPSIAIIVSFRDLHETQKRSEHLRKFIPYMVDFLTKCKTFSFHIYVIEQSDDGRKFNRGKLMNIGFTYAKQQHRYISYILHDVDLLPNDDLCRWYGTDPNENGVVHLAHAWGRYGSHPGFIGGVVSLSAEQIEAINGYPNNFWGWGGEDDEMSIRLNRTGIPVQYPTEGSYSDLESMDAGQKMDLLFSNRQWMNVEQQRLIKDQAIDDEWKRNGLATLEYEILSVAPIDGSGKATKVIVDVKLNGDHWTNGVSNVNYIY